MLLGRRTTDYDLATSATPRQVKRLFPHVLLIGAKFGVAMIIHHRRTVEVTTFRTDVSYSDGRRPDSVTFSSRREDALRRDFTINGMFYDPIEEKVIDYVGGKADLRKGVIRTIGDPRRRFAEDYLRMLRAVRFSVRFNFRIVPATARAIRKCAPNITLISGERIFDELSAMLSIESGPKALQIMNDLHLAQQILPELFERKLWKQSVRRVGAVAHREELMLTLGALLCELPSRTIFRIVRRWGASNKLRNCLGWISEHLQDWRVASDSMRLCDFKRLLANKHFEHLGVLWRIEERDQTGRVVCSRRIAQRIAAILPDEIAPRPFVTGKHLTRMGLEESPRMGRILSALYDAQLNEEIRSRRTALKAAREMVKNV